VKPKIQIAKAIVLGIELSDTRESHDWLHAATDEDLIGRIDASGRRRDILDLIEDTDENGWVTADVCEPRDGQLILFMLDTWDKPNTGVYQAGQHRVHVFGEKYIGVPSNRAAFYWKACELPAGVPRPRSPQQSFGQVRRQVEKDTREWDRKSAARRNDDMGPGNHDHGFQRNDRGREQRRSNENRYREKDRNHHQRGDRW